ncbi:MAG: CoA pyrophosphatase [Microthrixaceae bacterium]|nr:CoA pyrophosphatase [Microthrixaceae bacterium]
MTVDRVVEAVRGLGEPRPVPGGAPPGARPSAVLVPVYDDGGEAALVLTRRAQHLRAHKGEVSFPGGRREPGEGPVETALREAEEETALVPADVEVVGELDPLATFSSGSLIVPVVGRLDRRPALVAQEDEVEAILHVPISELLHEDTYRQELWRFPQGYHPLHFFEVPGDTIWGATARILHQLLLLVTGTGR